MREVLIIDDNQSTSAPRYRNLQDLPTAVFCEFISGARSDGIENQITLWWEEFSDDGRDRAYSAEREIGDWELDWSGPDFSFVDLLERMNAVIGDALSPLSERLAGDHGCIYFGGMTFSQIEKNIYRRAPYIYTNHAEAAEALNVDIRTFKRYWPENKPFPSHYTLFTG